jgi:hypothetical protein
MHLLLNKNMLISIIIITTLLILFTGIISLYNSINVYAYDITFWNDMESNIYIDQSGALSYIKSSYENSNVNEIIITEQDTTKFWINSIYNDNTVQANQYYKLDGSFALTSADIVRYPDYELGYINKLSNEYDIPQWLINELPQKIYFNQIDNTVSITNEITTGMTPTEFKVIHEGLGYVHDISLELFNYQGDLVSVTVPKHNTDFTIIDIPPSEQPYYLHFVKNPLETTVFYFISSQTDLTFILPQLNLYTGQAYKVNAPTSFSTIEFTNQKPTQVYIYRENVEDSNNFRIENINPTADKVGLNSTSFINLYIDENTYFVIIDSDSNSHAVDLTGISSDKVLEVSDIPYVPSNIGEIWESIEPTAPPLVITDIPIDTSIESLDTTKDELIYENKSNQSIDVHLHPSVNSNHFVIKQEKRINPDTSEIYWVDVTNPTKYAERSLKVYPNQRLVVQIFNGTFDFEYPIEYLDGSEIVSYTHGVDYSVVVNYGVYGSDPQATDGTGIVDNTGSAITYPDYPDTVENNTVVDDYYSYTNPYELPDFSLPSPLELYNSTKNILVSAVNYMGQFQVIYNMMPAPFPAIVHMVIGSLGVMLFIKIVS